MLLFQKKCVASDYRINFVSENNGKICKTNWITIKLFSPKWYVTKSMKQ